RRSRRRSVLRHHAGGGGPLPGPRLHHRLGQPARPVALSRKTRPVEYTSGHQPLPITRAGGVVRMAKLKFCRWVPTYAWSGGKSDPRNLARIRESIEKCEKYGIDVWVIDHLLSAPGLYGNAWLEPLNVLAYAAALTRKVKIATGILVLPVRHPVILAKEISTLCHLSQNRYVFGVGPGWYAREYEVTGSRIEERGRRTDEIIEAVTLLLTKPNASFSGKYYRFNAVTIEPRPPRMPQIWVSGGSRVPDPGEHDVPVIAPTVMDRIVKAGHWLSRCSGTQAWVKRDWGLLQEHARAKG